MFARNLSDSPEKQIVSAMKKPVGRGGGVVVVLAKRKRLQMGHAKQFMAMQGN